MSEQDEKVAAAHRMFPVNEQWLTKRTEEIIDPTLPIVDPHHHLWDRAARGTRYLFDELLADISSGHNIRATMHMQCASMYRADGDPGLAPVGETEFVNGIAAMSASGLFGEARACAGMIGFADLPGLGAECARTIEAHLAAAGPRFKGLRHNVVWDADKSIRTTLVEFPKSLLLDKKFREGFAQIGRYGLSYDVWLYHPQIAELADLAHAFPDTTIVLDHVGAPLAVGAYAGKRDEVRKVWRESLGALAACPNAHVKLGGMGMHVFGFDFDKRDMPPTSEELAAAWKPLVETCIELFGVERCMFESNFPVDKRSTSYAILWNAFKRIAASYSAREKTALFSGTARRVYRLPEN